MRFLKPVIGAALAGAMVWTGAIAGLRQPAPVNVDLVASFASGDLVTAADAKSNEVFIGCGTRNFDDGAGGVFEFAFCQAKDAEGDTINCLTDNPELVRTVREINDTSYVQFRWVDDGLGGFTCTHTGFSTQSFYLDKHNMGNQKGKER